VTGSTCKQGSISCKEDISLGGVVLKGLKNGTSPEKRVTKTVNVCLRWKKGTLQENNLGGEL